MDHTPTRVPVASGAGFIKCSCGWKSMVQDDGAMFGPNPYNADAAFRGHLQEVVPTCGDCKWCLKTNSTDPCTRICDCRVPMWAEGGTHYTTEVTIATHCQTFESIHA